MKSLSVSQLKIMEDSVAKDIRELQRESMKTSSRIVLEAISRYSTVLQNRFDEISKELSTRE